jgi:hypothetical protein
MLRSFSEEIRHCYEHAEACARKAEYAASEEMRHDFLRLEQSWLQLARSYQLVEGLTGRNFEHHQDGKRSSLNS